MKFALNALPETFINMLQVSGSEMFYLSVTGLIAYIYRV
jgi:hypothetical protein